MRALCFTVDLDRDVNIPIRGRSAAGSMDRGNGTSPRFVSSEKGTELLSEMLDSLGIRATFFAEARTIQNTDVSGYLSGHEVAMHGLDHEDYTGEKTSLRYDYGDLREFTERSISMIRDGVGRQPKGFRSPYMSPNEDMLSFLSEYGITYDSSYYAYADRRMAPYRLDSGLTEIPVPKSVDMNGSPITGYLWTMHEGTRRKEDFIDLASRVEDGAFVIATHSWHICETEKGALDDDEAGRNIEDIRSIIVALMDMGFRPMTMSEAATIRA